MIGEESASESGAKPVLTAAPTWCVDPIDGTTNFVHGFYFSCVSIGFLVDRQARENYRQFNQMCIFLMPICTSFYEVSCS